MLILHLLCLQRTLIIGGIVSIAIGEGSQYYGIVFYQFERPYYLLENALYACLHRVFFACLFSWFLLSYLTTGYGKNIIIAFLRKFAILYQDDNIYQFSLAVTFIVEQNNRSILKIQVIDIINFKISGVLNPIVNHRIFTVLGRMTYSVFLMNTLSLITLVASIRTPVFYSYKMIVSIILFTLYLQFRGKKLKIFSTFSDVPRFW